jgi:O-antigen/teichoic acid export membrane protein
MNDQAANPAEPAATVTAAAMTAPQPRRGVGRLRRWFRDGPLRRVYRNAGILLGGKTMAGLMELAAFALAARALGPGPFGILIMVMAYAQLIAGLAKFQSWQAVIHYGARCLEQGRRADFQSLVKFTALLDFGSAAAGALIAAAAAPLAGYWIGWDARTVTLAMFASLLVLTTISATPNGILRLFDRFDLLAGQSAVTPALRLIGTVAAFSFGADLTVFVVIWFASGIIGRLTLATLAWRELARQGFTHDMTWSLRRLVKPHPGLWRFVWSSNLSLSITTVVDRAPPLVIGWVLGPAAVGLFEVARRFAVVIVKPVSHLGQTIYPELAKLSSRDDPKAIRKLVLRASAVAGGVALIAFAAIAAAGPYLIGWTVGAAYADAYGLLVLLALTSTISVFAFPMGPVMYATGRPHIVLRVIVAISVFYFSLLAILLWQVGLIGAGIAAVARASANLTLQSLIARRLLSKRQKGPAAEPSRPLPERAGAR